MEMCVGDGDVSPSSLIGKVSSVQCFVLLVGSLLVIRPCYMMRHSCRGCSWTV